MAVLLDKSFIIFLCSYVQLVLDVFSLFEPLIMDLRCFAKGSCGIDGGGQGSTGLRLRL